MNEPIHFMLIDGDECRNNAACRHGACVDGIASFTCSCIAGYTSYFCDCEYPLFLTLFLHSTQALFNLSSLLETFHRDSVNYDQWTVCLLFIILSWRKCYESMISEGYQINFTSYLYVIYFRCDSMLPQWPMWFPRHMSTRRSGWAGSRLCVRRGVGRGLVYRWVVCQMCVVCVRCVPCVSDVCRVCQMCVRCVSCVSDVCCVCQMCVVCVRCVSCVSDVCRVCRVCQMCVVCVRCVSCVSDVCLVCQMCVLCVRCVSCVSDVCLVCQMCVRCVRCVPCVSDVCRVCQMCVMGVRSMCRAGTHVHVSCVSDVCRVCCVCQMCVRCVSCVTRGGKETQVQVSCVSDVCDMCTSAGCVPDLGEISVSPADRCQNMAYCTNSKVNFSMAILFTFGRKCQNLCGVRPDFSTPAGGRGTPPPPGIPGSKHRRIRFLALFNTLLVYKTHHKSSFLPKLNAHVTYPLYFVVFAMYQCVPDWLSVSSPLNFNHYIRVMKYILDLKQIPTEVLAVINMDITLRDTGKTYTTELSDPTSQAFIDMEQYNCDLVRM